jgi:hypothetical protein
LEVSLRWFFGMFSGCAKRPIKKQEAQRLLRPNTRHNPDKPQSKSRQVPTNHPKTYPKDLLFGFGLGALWVDGLDEALGLVE